MPGTQFSLEIQPHIPDKIKRLEELANNLVYSWDRRIRGLFHHMDPVLWVACGHNPKALLNRVSQERLNELETDSSFLEEYHHATSVFDSYLAATAKPKREIAEQIDQQHDLIAYFCAEFGFHESLQLYSGGLGILAADHCKAASNVGVPFVAVGLMYRQGYFAQTIGPGGEQQAHYRPVQLDELPVRPARDSRGREIAVKVGLLGRIVMLKVWEALIGHVRLYMLDSEVPENAEGDRRLTYQLYGGDRRLRIAQEMILGIGGVRALRALGLNPSVWHINEGHSAFLVIERCREAVKSGLDFDSALEQVAAATVFTTHTPVAAGHDLFEKDIVTQHFSDYMTELGITMERFLTLGASPQNHDRFNMTTLALRGSRFCNGVSRIHGGVASRMEAYIWPQLQANENPMAHITNGVHIQTFLAREWATLFDARFKGWQNHLIGDTEYWQKCIASIPDHRFWSMHQSVKIDMLVQVRERLIRQYRRNQLSDAHIERLLARLSPQQPEVLVLGFARRFATYKRVLLLFRDPARLARLLDGGSERPIVIIFAGKAHPQDQPGQDLIRQLNAYARQSEFSGKVFFIEDYSIALARKLVTGVDVWLNTPLYPLEACGTSGQKAAINGVLNVSVADGWWAEGFDGTNGWAIASRTAVQYAEHRDEEEARELLDILEQEVIPQYFNRANAGYPEAWVAKAKRSMQTILPYFNSHRMFEDYTKNCYAPAIRQGRLLAANDGRPAAELAQWKKKVSECWPGVRIRRLNDPPVTVKMGEPLPLEIGVRLNGLDPANVGVECVFGDEDEEGNYIRSVSQRLEPVGGQGDETVFKAVISSERCGLYQYQIRCFPQHPMLSHPFETGCMLWL
ncbi:MAG: alpha-glucan family phosphorylase [Gammaproteobacteria bacterium]